MSPVVALSLPNRQGRHDEAIGGYHKALGLKPDDPFAAEMLNKALDVRSSSQSNQAQNCVVFFGTANREKARLRRVVSAWVHALLIVGQVVMGERERACGALSSCAVGRGFELRPL